MSVVVLVKKKLIVGQREIRNITGVPDMFRKFRKSKTYIVRLPYAGDGEMWVSVTKKHYLTNYLIIASLMLLLIVAVLVVKKLIVG